MLRFSVAYEGFRLYLFADETSQMAFCFLKYSVVHMHIRIVKFVALVVIAISPFSVMS